MFVEVLGRVEVKLEHIPDVERFPGTLHSLNITILFKIITFNILSYKHFFICRVGIDPRLIHFLCCPV